VDSYQAKAPVGFDICPPSLIGTEKSIVCSRKKTITRVSSFIFIILHGRKATFFLVESSDGDIRKLVLNVVSEITKTSTKYEPKS